VGASQSDYKVPCNFDMYMDSYNNNEINVKNNIVCTLFNNQTRLVINQQKIGSSKIKDFTLNYLSSSITFDTADWYHGSVLNYQAVGLPSDVQF